LALKTNSFKKNSALYLPLL